MPNSRIEASDVTEQLRERLCAAEEIWLVDPDHGMGQEDRHQWMELLVSVPPPVPEVVDPSSPQPGPIVLEIEVDSTDHEGLIEIRERVRRLCGEPSIEPPYATGKI